jgi:uncharacterized RDD family membrane protein YckC
MESIDILTGQNVVIRYQTATILQRAGARLLDIFFLFAYLFSIYSFIEMIELNSYSREWIILIILLWLPALGYHFIFESMLGGKTPGKMIVKIKVTNVDGSIPGIGAYFLRWLLSLVDFWILWGSLGAIFILFSRNHQRLGDMAAGTIVVKTNSSLAFDLDESYYEFPDSYEPTFIHVDRLTEGQIAFITNMLIEPKNRNAMSASISELTNKVKSLLNVESNLDERKFLETVVRDYNYYAALEI